MFVRAESAPHTDRRDWHNLRGMLPFVWEYRGRVLLALGCLVLAKVATVGIPLVLKRIVDGLEQAGQGQMVMPLAPVAGLRRAAFR